MSTILSIPILLAIFLAVSLQSITGVFSPEIVVGVIKKDDQALVGVFKLDNKGSFYIHGPVKKPILHKYHCFGFGKGIKSCDFIKY